MWAVFAGPLKPDVPENLSAYYNSAFDVFESYYDIDEYRLPENWGKKHGPGKQMDWGSCLYVCRRDSLWELIGPASKVHPVIPAGEDEELAKILPAIKAGGMPEAEWYGVLEVECY